MIRDYSDNGHIVLSIYYGSAVMCSIFAVIFTLVLLKAAHNVSNISVVSAMMFILYVFCFYVSVIAAFKSWVSYFRIKQITDEAARQ